MFNSRLVGAGLGLAGRLRASADPWPSLQTVVEGVPYQLFLMAPYVLSILALILVARRAEVPASLMVPYRRGER